MCKHEWRRYEISGMWSDNTKDGKLDKPDIASFSLCKKCGTICYVNPETNKPITASQYKERQGGRKMYLKIRQEVSCGKGKGKKVKWHIIQVPDDVDWEWVDYGNKDIRQVGERIILSKDNPEHVRRIFILQDRKKENIDSKIIYCDDDVYLCNNNGKTIERF